jgi:hypothetical protein
MSYCSNCGTKLVGSKIFCPKCKFRHNVDQLEKLELQARLNKDQAGTEETGLKTRKGNIKDEAPSQYDPSRRHQITSQRGPPIPSSRDEEEEVDTSERGSSYLSSRGQRNMPTEEATVAAPQPAQRQPPMDMLTRRQMQEQEAETPGRKINITIVKGNCSYCETVAQERCFFCMAPCCSRHVGKMKIFVRNNPFGSPVKACPKCQEENHGQMPSEQEAQKASMFFNVKPYHEWRVVKG